MYQQSKEVPAELTGAITAETFEKARVYGLDREQFSIFKSIITDVIIASLEFYFGFLALVWHKSARLAENFNLDRHSEIQVTCVFMIVLNSINFSKICHSKSIAFLRWKSDTVSTSKPLGFSSRTKSKVSSLVN